MQMLHALWKLLQPEKGVGFWNFRQEKKKIPFQNAARETPTPLLSAGFFLSSPQFR